MPSLLALGHRAMWKIPVSHVDAASLGVLPSSAGNDEPASVDHRSERLKNLGFSEAVIQRLEKARATSTSKHHIDEQTV